MVANYGDRLHKANLEMAALLADKGHELALMFTDESGVPYNQTSREIQLIARMHQYHGKLWQNRYDTQTKRFYRGEFPPLTQVFVEPHNARVLTLLDMARSSSIGNDSRHKTSAPSSEVLAQMYMSVFGNNVYIEDFPHEDQERMTDFFHSGDHFYMYGADSNVQGAKKTLEKLNGRVPFTGFIDGRSTIYIDSSADLDRNSAAIIRSLIAGNSSYCMCPGVIAYHKRIKDPVHRLMKKLGELKVGDPTNPETNIGPSAFSTMYPNDEKWEEDYGWGVIVPGRREGNLCWPMVIDTKSVDIPEPYGTVMVYGENAVPVFFTVPVESFEEFRDRLLVPRGESLSRGMIYKLGIYATDPRIISNALELEGRRAVNVLVNKSTVEPDMLGKMDSSWLMSVKLGGGTVTDHDLLQEIQLIPYQERQLASVA